MEGTDIIAYIYPYGNNVAATQAILRNPQHVAPILRTSPTGGSSLNSLPRVEIRFRDTPRSERGIVFGSNPNCDIVLAVRDVSSQHYSLTFDKSKHLIVKDLGSLNGTQVTYDGNGTGKRHGFHWIVGGARTPREMEKIINVNNSVFFQIVVPHYDITSPKYIDQVNLFCQGRSTAEELLDDLRVDLPITEMHTNTHTPHTADIFLRKILGEGSFGVVTHYWNVSSGREYALKTPTTQAIRTGKFRLEDWEHEAAIMRPLSHEHIVTLFDAQLLPYPKLFLEYAHCGSLLDIMDSVTRTEVLAIHNQCLSALTYLHGKSPPIAHRDIKPANILVAHRENGVIRVKLGDFGLSRDSLKLNTFCGTESYLAPEIYLKKQHGNGSYTAAVDVWYLGVVVYELVCEQLPYQSSDNHSGIEWCEQIVEQVGDDLQTGPDQLKQFLADTMLVKSPISRFSARACHDEAINRLSSMGYGAILEPVHTSYAKEELQATIRRSSGYQASEDPKTIHNPSALSPKSARTLFGWEKCEACGNDFLVDADDKLSDPGRFCGTMVDKAGPSSLATVEGKGSNKQRRRATRHNDAKDVGVQNNEGPGSDPDTKFTSTARDHGSIPESGRSTSSEDDLADLQDAKAAATADMFRVMDRSSRRSTSSAPPK